ncbi:hypothetical protein GF319_06455 [Candidatus Bathyarchaeota archaeon]|nr:hypothetical protein [Candidatus Bathyarchaeota archaeon]
MKKTIRITILSVVFLYLLLSIEVGLVIADDGDDYEVSVGYETYSGDLYYSDDEAIAFQDTLDDDYSWTSGYTLGDSNHHESHWVCSSEGGSDNSYFDDADVAWFSGHGDHHSFLTGSSWYMDGYVVDGSECEWGDDDLEWVFLYSCMSLNYTDYTTWNGAFLGLHGICGWDTETLEHNGWYGLGEETADQLMYGSRSVGVAWEYATKWFIQGGDPSTRAATYTAKSRRTSDGYIFDYYAEEIDDRKPDYTDVGYTLYTRTYRRWDC